jgi:hypothetical protein
MPSRGAGLRDGGFDTAAFNRPQGVAYSPSGDALYVADTENHALRKVRRRLLGAMSNDGQCCVRFVAVLASARTLHVSSQGQILGGGSGRPIATRLAVIKLGGGLWRAGQCAGPCAVGLAMARNVVRVCRWTWAAAGSSPSSATARGALITWVVAGKGFY